jgi:hydrogenase nickel incorporation protein HypA/HybF
LIIHELAVTESLLKIVLKHAEENGANRVLSIQLQVGELRDLTEEWMQRYFDYLSEGTPAEGGKILMTRIPVAFRCEACAHTFSADIRQSNLLCPACGHERCELIAGNEFLIESIGVI